VGVWGGEKEAEKAGLTHFDMFRRIFTRISTPACMAVFVASPVFADSAEKLATTVPDPFLATSAQVVHRPQEDRIRAFLKQPKGWADSMVVTGPYGAGKSTITDASLFDRDDATDQLLQVPQAGVVKLYLKGSHESKDLIAEAALGKLQIAPPGLGRSSTDLLADLCFAAKKQFGVVPAFVVDVDFNRSRESLKALKEFIWTVTRTGAAKVVVVVANPFDVGLLSDMVSELYVCTFSPFFARECVFMRGFWVGYKTVCGHR
jgi:hypothetical protein